MSSNSIFMSAEKAKMSSINSKVEFFRRLKRNIATEIQRAVSRGETHLNLRKIIRLSNENNEVGFNVSVAPEFNTIIEELRGLGYKIQEEKCEDGEIIISWE